MAGFGGVAEYGITVRWDKNFLKMVRLLVERRAQFALFGGVRFGGTITRRRAPSTWASTTSRSRAGAGTPDRARHAQRPRARRAHGVGFPDGAAAHRRRARRTRSPTCRCACRSWWSAAASPPSTPRPNRSPTTRCRSRSSWRATRRWRASTARTACAAEWNEEETRDRRGVPRPCARDPRRARCAPRREGREPRILELLQSWGGVDDRLPQAPDRQPVATRSTTRKSRRRSRKASASPRASRRCASSRSLRPCARARRAARNDRCGGGIDRARSTARPHHPHRRRHAAQHRARARGPRAFRARRPLSSARSTTRASR